MAGTAEQDRSTRPQDKPVTGGTRLVFLRAFAKAQGRTLTFQETVDAIEYERTPREPPVLPVRPPGWRPPTPEEALAKWNAFWEPIIREEKRAKFAERERVAREAAQARGTEEVRSRPVAVAAAAPVARARERRAAPSRASNNSGDDDSGSSDGPPPGDGLGDDSVRRPPPSPDVLEREPDGVPA